MTLRATILVGHGAPPSDYPGERVARLKMLERRRAADEPPSDEEARLDREVRDWPRTDANDPYRAGIERLAAVVRARIAPEPLYVAYNEFCAPSLADAVESAIAAGASCVRVVPTMLVPGGVHSEVEIPRTLDALRRAHPSVEIAYAWPIALDAIADVLVAAMENRTGSPR